MKVPRSDERSAIPPEGVSQQTLEEAAERAERLVQSFRRITSELGKVIVGQEEVVEQLMVAILAGGHCLLEGVPGLAKTAMVRSLSRTMDLTFRRIQFTPDLMPADITGTEIIQEETTPGARGLEFQKGPIFVQMILADEINRAPPKTQAALLEAMEEHRVTVGGRSLDVPSPFFVLGTQNPIEQEGTYPLPEAEKDRFLFQVNIDYPGRGEERKIAESTAGNLGEILEPVITASEILEAQRAVRDVPVPDHVLDFVMDLVRRTRPGAGELPVSFKELIQWGAGPRASQALILGGKARALFRGRYCLKLEDVETLACPVLRHRIVPTFSAEAERVDIDAIISRVLETVPRVEVKGVL